MPEQLAYLNGDWIPAAQLTVPVYDAGFVQGVTVAEQLRTFGGQLFRLSQHLERLARSMQIVGIQLSQSSDDLAAAATELAERNHRLLDEGDDLGLCIFVTPGPYAAMAPAGSTGSMVAMHTYPLPFRAFAATYHAGQRLVTTSTRQVPGECWPAELKCRSRMHYYLADREAAASDARARALLLDLDGFVVEASTANVIAYYRDRGFVSPPRDKILPGVSVAVLAELAKQSGIPFDYADLTANDVRQADEVMLSSTSCCLLPAVSIDGHDIHDGKPGDVQQRMLQAWSKLVQVDIVAQAQRLATRPE